MIRTEVVLTADIKGDFYPEDNVTTREGKQSIATGQKVGYIETGENQRVDVVYDGPPGKILYCARAGKWVHHYGVLLRVEPIAVLGDGKTKAAACYSVTPVGAFIVSDLVGIYYPNPTPDSQPFVSKGDIIQPGAQVGVIEAMKVFVSIEYIGDGPVEVVEILAKKGRLVSVGDKLMQVRPTTKETSG